MEVLVKQHEVAPVRIGLKLLQISEDGSSSTLVLQEYARHAARQFAGNIPQRKHPARSSWEFDLEVVTKVVMELLKRLDQKEIEGKPDWPAPVGIPTEQPRRRFAWIVVHPVHVPIHVQHVRIIAVELRKSANPIGRKEFTLIQHVLQNP